MDCDWLSMFFNRSDSDSNYILLLCCYHYRCIPILIELERVLNFIVMSLVQVTFKGTVNMSLKMNIRHYLLTASFICRTQKRYFEECW